MINTLNTVTASAKGLAQDMSPLSQQIAKRADVNGDGNVSSSEFTLFMNELLAKLEEPSQSSSSAVSSSAQAAPGATAAATAAKPATTAPAAISGVRSVGK